LIVIKRCGVVGQSLDPDDITLLGLFRPLDGVDGRDTGYRSVADGQDEETVPRCPAFQLIGQKYGPYDLASFVPLLLSN
jgi:hypothetical protein